jgi:hypothetical protein
LLYSIGLDGQDNGGRPEQVDDENYPGRPRKKDQEAGDWVWMYKK